MNTPSSHAIESMHYKNAISNLIFLILTFSEDESLLFPVKKNIHVKDSKNKYTCNIKFDNITISGLQSHF